MKDHKIIIGDISHQQAEQSLATILARMHALLEAVVDGIISIDEYGLIHMVKPAAERLFGYAEEETPHFPHCAQALSCIDEVAEMTPALQAKLLRVLEDGHYRRVGSSSLDLAEVERRTVLAALKQMNGNKVHAAEALGISRRALCRLLARYRIDAHENPDSNTQPSDPLDSSA
jgi:transcriptional regulator with PAS, ATPase and Fis domain